MANLVEYGEMNSDKIQILHAATQAAQKGRFLPDLLEKDELNWRADTPPNGAPERLQLATAKNEINAKGWLSATKVHTGFFWVKYNNLDPM